MFKKSNIILCLVTLVFGFSVVSADISQSSSNSSDQSAVLSQSNDPHHLTDPSKVSQNVVVQQSPTTKPTTTSDDPHNLGGQTTKAPVEVGPEPTKPPVTTNPVTFHPVTTNPTSTTKPTSEQQAATDLISQFTSNGVIDYSGLAKALESSNDTNLAVAVFENLPKQEWATTQRVGSVPVKVGQNPIQLLANQMTNASFLKAIDGKLQSLRSSSGNRNFLKEVRSIVEQRLITLTGPITTQPVQTPITTKPIITPPIVV